MVDKFKVGDVCVVIYEDDDPRLIGMEVITLESGVIQRCEDVDWIPAYHFATRIKKLEKQVEELKESLKCVLFEMDFATDALYAGYGTEDTDEITLARKRAE